MKSFVRIGSFAIALGVAGLFTGCSNWSNVTQRARPATDFEVVETSAKRLLTAKEMVEMRAAVAKYLEKQGAVSSGDYYVKVFLTPDKDGVASDWVIVRFTRDTELRFQLLGSDDAYFTSYRSYASYDYYPYGYDSFGRISFQYYDDPYYGNRYYYPRHDGHDRDHDRDKDRDRDRGRGHDGDKPSHYVPGSAHPATPAGPPQVTPANWDRNSPDRNSQPREQNYHHHHDDPGSRPERVPESRNYSPASGESTRREERSAPPASSPPAPHVDARESPSVDHGPRESSRTDDRSKRQDN